MSACGVADLTFRNDECPTNDEGNPKYEIQMTKRSTIFGHSSFGGALVGHSSFSTGIIQPTKNSRRGAPAGRFIASA
jgi:hypothetical protein